MGFEPTTSAGERPETYASDRAVTGTGQYLYLLATLVTGTRLAAVTVRHGNRTHTAISNESKTHEERISNCRTLDLSVNKLNVIYLDTYVLS